MLFLIPFSSQVVILKQRKIQFSVINQTPLPLYSASCKHLVILNEFYIFHISFFFFKYSRRFPFSRISEDSSDKVQMINPQPSILQKMLTKSKCIVWTRFQANCQHFVSPIFTSKFDETKRPSLANLKGLYVTNLQILSFQYKYFQILNQCINMSPKMTIIQIQHIKLNGLFNRWNKYTLDIGSNTFLFLIKLRSM